MDLTMGLALVAGAVMLALVAHGLWQERRAAPRQPEPEPLPETASRVEPTLHEAPRGERTPPPDLDPDLDAPLRPHATQRRSVRIDALIDAIATVIPETPVSGEAALMHWPATRRAGTKSFAIEGLNQDSREWEMPRAGQRYREFQAGVQLANRHGALNEIEYSEFIQKVQTFADAFGAGTDFPDMLDAVARGRELDQFAASHDAQLTAGLRASSVAWSLGFLEQCAARHGFVPGSVPGRLVLPATEEGAPPLLTLTFDAQVAMAEEPGQAALREVTLSLDVAQTPEAAEPFAAWQQSARRLADELDAQLIDDQGATISLHAFTAIEQELQRLYRALEARDLAAGTAAARRLFS